MSKRSSQTNPAEPPVIASPGAMTPQAFVDKWRNVTVYSHDFLKKF